MHLEEGKSWTCTEHYAKKLKCSQVRKDSLSGVVVQMKTSLTVSHILILFPNWWHCSSRSRKYVMPLRFQTFTPLPMHSPCFLALGLKMCALSLLLQPPCLLYSLYGKLLPFVSIRVNKPFLQGFVVHGILYCNRKVTDTSGVWVSFPEL